MAFPFTSAARCAAAALAAGVIAASSVGAQEQDFPGKRPIELTVLFPAGSSADVTARILAEGMAKQLGTNVIVINKPGGGGAVGYKYVVAQKADGYSIVWNSNSISTTYHSGMIPFDYRAFEPVARVLVETPLLAVKADSPWKSLRDLVAEAKANPGKITVGNSGAGSHTHICSVALFKAAGVTVTDVPFGAAQVIPSLVGGHVNAVMQLPAALTPQMASGQIRALAAMSARRDPAFPDVPTAQEQGYDVALEAWRGIAVPKGTPKAVIGALEEAIRKTAASAEFTRAAERLSVTPAFMPAEDFGRLIAREDGEMAQLMGAIGLKTK